MSRYTSCSGETGLPAPPADYEPSRETTDHRHVSTHGYPIHDTLIAERLSTGHAGNEG